MVFKPKGSSGWAWLVAFGGVMIASAILGLTAGGGAIPAAVWAIELSIIALGLWFFALAAMFPTMRYEVGEGELRLRYGPLHWDVPLGSIRSVRRTDLVWTIWSSMRFPGFALYKVMYGAGVGAVRMCATRAANGVLLIDADAGRYGVTPADEAGFLLALGQPAGSAELVRTTGG